jgi:hypothetical protein
MCKNPISPGHECPDNCPGKCVKEKVDLKSLEKSREEKKKILEDKKIVNKK